MSRRLVALFSLISILSASLASSVAAQTAEGPPAVPDTLRAFSIVPPGQEGEVTGPELISGDYGPHYSDQLEMYAKLITDDDIAEDELSTYFHSMQFGLAEGEEAESSYSPREGVTVYRDSKGIPHIYADTIENASFALGYVTGEDRLFQADVFRHAARGTLSEFIGPSYLDMDIATRREGYTEEEVQKMFDDFDDRFGPVGGEIQKGLQAYADGINAYIDEVRTDPSKCSSEYAATQNPCPAPHPEEWAPTDTLFLAILQLRIFGLTAGGELDNAGFYANLVKNLGRKTGRAAFEDFLRRNDPKSPTSVNPAQATFPSQKLGRTNWKSVAIPDDAQQLARDTRRVERVRRDFLASLGFRAPASNALLVSARKSTTGNPLQIGAPQVGYAVPAFFMDVDVHAGNDHFRGPAVPGASALIPLGRGADYAWSLTTGYSDAVDTRAELLCDPAGGEATVESNGYIFKGNCKEMQSREETFIVKPSAADPGPPDMHTETFYRTLHGPVIARGKVNGKPVAFTHEMFFWKKELHSIPQFYKWNTAVDSVEDFKAAAKRFTMSFNTFYADANDIGYFHIGHYPRRAAGVHPALPTWGTGQWEWGGRLPFRRHPQVINPRQGWVANWNNKPAKGWDNYDGAKWGPIHRVSLLTDRMKQLLNRGKARLSDLVDVIRDAATRDTRGAYLGRRMLRFVAAGAEGDADKTKALDFVRQWIKAGSHRRDADGDGTDDSGPAVTVWDHWYEFTVHKIFDDEIGRDNYDLLAADIAGQSMWFDFSSYLKNLFNAKSRAGYARNYCDDVTTTDKRESCAEVVMEGLEQALTFLKAEQGADMTQWKTDAWMIEFQQLGAGSVDPIPWQNRGTHNHVVEVLREAPGS